MITNAQRRALYAEAVRLEAEAARIAADPNPASTRLEKTRRATARAHEAVGIRMAVNVLATLPEEQPEEPPHLQGHRQPTAAQRVRIVQAWMDTGATVREIAAREGLHHDVVSEVIRQGDVYS